MAGREILKSLYLAIFIALTAPVAVLAQPLDSYIARLSTADHYNSRRQRLDNVAAIIRQDRANVYVFVARDLEDEEDSFFASKANRAKLERMLNRGTISRSAKRAILHGTPLIQVDIYADFINVRVFDD